MTLTRDQAPTLPLRVARASLGLLLAVACGGSEFTSDDEGMGGSNATGASTSRGGSKSGGSGGTAGSGVSTGGKATGGKGGTGGTDRGGTSSGGAGNEGGTDAGGTSGTGATGGAGDAGGASGASGSAGSGGTSGSAGKGGSGGTSGSGGKAGSGGTSGSAGKGGTGGIGGIAGTGGLGGSGARGGSGGRAGAGGAAGACGVCDWECCGATCVNKNNDVKNCGSCGHPCQTGQSCNNGVCGTPPCTTNDVICTANAVCCGTTCCPLTSLCCVVPGPVGPSQPQCLEPNAQGTCPLGCRTCECAAPDTPIATPNGDRPIAELRVGDLVYSVDDFGVVVVPIAEVGKKPARGHAIPVLTLEDGRELFVSAGHPTADGRTFGDVAPGDALGEATVVAVRWVGYPHPFTYDIRPASRSGAYFAAGALIGSTLGGQSSASVLPISAPPAK